MRKLLGEGGGGGTLPTALLLHEGTGPRGKSEVFGRVKLQPLITRTNEKE